CGGPGPTHRRQHHRHRTSLQLRWLLDHTVVGQLGCEALQQLLAEGGAFVLPAPETDRDPDLVVVVEEGGRLPLRDVEVMISDPHPHAEFLDARARLLLASLSLLDGLLVLVTPVVHQTTHRRLGVGRHFDQIEIELLGEPEGLVELLDADLLPVRCDHQDLFCPDGVVHSQFADAVASSCSMKKAAGGCPAARNAVVTDGSSNLTAARPGAAGWGSRCFRSCHVLSRRQVTRGAALFLPRATRRWPSPLRWRRRPPPLPCCPARAPNGPWPATRRARRGPRGPRGCPCPGPPGSTRRRSPGRRCR